MESDSLIALLLSFGFPTEDSDEALRWLTNFSILEGPVMCVLVSFLQIEKKFSFQRIKALRVAIALFNTGYPDFTEFPKKFSSQPWSEIGKTTLVKFLMGELTPEEFQSFILWAAAPSK
jgi:hypothetical protein